MLDPPSSGGQGPISLQHVVFQVGLRHRVERQWRPDGHRCDLEGWILPSTHVV
jgi:hypothetical protein